MTVHPGQKAFNDIIVTHIVKKFVTNSLILLHAKPILATVLNYL